jgi:hypothetical protein
VDLADERVGAGRPGLDAPAFTTQWVRPLGMVDALTAAIERFTREWNASARPFTWVKTADEILAKAVRKTQADSGARHWRRPRPARRAVVESIGPQLREGLGADPSMDFGRRESGVTSFARYFPLNEKA